MLNPAVEENQDTVFKSIMVIVIASLYIYLMLMASFFMEYNSFNFWFLILTSLIAMTLIFAQIGKMNFRFK